MVKSNSPANYEKHNNTPSWIYNANLPGYFTVVGFAPIQNMGGEEAQRRVALSKARHELAQTIRVRMEAEERTHLTDSNGELDSGYSRDIKATTLANIRLGDEQILKEWKDPRSGELYLLVGIPLQGK